MLDVYRSRLFNKRRKSRFAKRMSIFAFNRRDSTMPHPPSLNNMSSYGGGDAGGDHDHGGGKSIGRRFSISSSKESLDHVIIAEDVVTGPGASIISQNPTAVAVGADSSTSNVLSMETDQFESMINRLSLADEDQLLNLLTEYFMAKEDVNLFSCTSASKTIGEDNSTTNDTIPAVIFNSSKSTYSIETTAAVAAPNGSTSQIKRFASANEIITTTTTTTTTTTIGNNNNSKKKTSSASKKIRNRCYYASVQAHMAQAFKSMDVNFDNRLSFQEFANGVRAMLNENAMKRVCAKSYYKFAANLVQDDTVLRRLFAKLDLNADGLIDFGI